MSMVKTAMYSTPLLVRVVCLYVFIAAPLWAVSFVNQPAAPVVLAQPPSTTQATKHEVKKQVISGQPAQISIVRLGLDLPIIDGVYDAKHDTWTLSDDSVQYATMTALPNDAQGNTFLYGHNTPAVLERVKDVVSGDILTIKATNGKVFSYTYIGDLSVTPDKTDVLSASASHPRVTLMTCEGLFSETRRLLYFDFLGVL